MRDLMKIDNSVLYGKRMLVFLEEEPQSNNYRQVCLTSEEYKNIALSLGTIQELKEEQKKVKLELSEDEYQLPDLKEIYEFTT